MIVLTNKMRFFKCFRKTPEPYPVCWPLSPVCFSHAYWN